MRSSMSGSRDSVVADLVRRCETLEAEVVQLRTEMGLARHAETIGRIVDQLGVRPGEGRLLAALMARRGAALSHDRLREAISPGDRDDDYRCEELVRVYVSRLRGHGVKIVTVPLYGYRLADGEAVRLREMIDWSR